MSWQLPADQYLDLPNVPPSENLCAWGHLILGSVDTYLSNPERWRDEDYDNVQSAIDDLLAALADRICGANMMLPTVFSQDYTGTMTAGVWNARRCVNVRHPGVGDVFHVPPAHGDTGPNVEPGVYRVHAWASAYRVSEHTMRIKYAGGYVYGSTEIAANSATGQNKSVLNDYVHHAGGYIEMEHNCTTSQPGNGMGRGGLHSPNTTLTTAQIMLWRIGPLP